MTADAFKRQLVVLGAEYRKGLPDKLARIDALWSDLSAGPVSRERLGELLRELHTIAGSARTFGVAGVSEAAAAAEAFLEPYCKRRKLPNGARHTEFFRLLSALRQAIQ